MSLVEFVKSFEGFSATPYRDVVGVVTIGYGTTKGITMQTPAISEAEATRLLEEELEVFASKVDRLIKVELSENERNALTSFCYNLGGGALQRSTLRQKLNRDDRLGAANEFPKWCMAGGKKLKGLLRRRLAEREMFLL